jgi:neutral trehalase
MCQIVPFIRLAQWTVTQFSMSAEKSETLETWLGAFFPDTRAARRAGWDVTNFRMVNFDF